MQFKEHIFSKNISSIFQRKSAIKYANNCLIDRNGQSNGYVKITEKKLKSICNFIANKMSRTKTNYSDEENEEEEGRNTVYKTNDYMERIRGKGDGDLYFFENKDFEDDKYASDQYFKKNVNGYQSRNWCFTWNNYPPDHKEKLLNLSSNIVYVIWGYEIGPKTGTRHLQGFIIFETHQRYGQISKKGQYDPRSLKGRIPGAYWKPMYSNAKACIKYCKKDINYFTDGTEPVGQGNRSDLDVVCNKIVEGGVKLEELAREHPASFVRFSKGFLNLYTLLQKHRTERPVAVWLYGKSGVGKTKVAFTLHGKDNVFVKQDAIRFWGLYDQEPAVIINEFLPITHGKTGWVFQELIQILDEYKFIVEVKGGHMKFNSRCIYITSIHPPTYFYPDPVEFSQLIRRLDMVYRVQDEDTVIPHDEFEYWSKDRVKEITFRTPLLLRMQAIVQTITAQKALARARGESSSELASEKKVVYSDEED